MIMIMDALKNFYKKKVKPLSESKKVFILYFILIQIVYSAIYFQYFQQDEWFFIAYFHQMPFTLQGAWEAFIAPFTDPTPFAFHLTPIGTFICWLEFKLFALHFQLYAALSLLLHTLCSFLVYGFARRITQNRFISIVAGTFYAITFSHSQATTWMAAHLQTQTAAISVLLAINYFFDYLQTNKRKQYFLGIIFFLVSVLTKETGALLIIFLPLLAFMYKSWKILGKLTLFYVTAITFIVFRIFVPPLVVALTHAQSISGISSKNQDILFSLYYTLTFYLKVLSESFIPLPTLNWLSMRIADFGYPQYTAQKEVWGSDYITFIQSAGTDIAMYLTGFLIAIVGMYILFNFSQNKIYKKALLISFFFILFAILPLTFLAGWLLSMLSYFSIVESRHLYLTNIGISIFVAFGIYWFYLQTQQRSLVKLIARIILIIAFFVWVGLQMYIICHDPSTNLQTASDRKKILNTYLWLQAKLDNKTVFYSESNVALYGFGSYMLPFQNNPIQYLVGSYGYRQTLPKEFYEKKTIIKNLTEEWYQEYDGIGLGYYLNKKHLLQAVVQHDIHPDDIVAVKYDGRGHFVYDITSEIRDQVRNFLNKREELKKWHKYEDKKYLYSFFYPPGYIVEKETPEFSEITSQITIRDEETGELFFRIQIIPVAEDMGVSNLISTLPDAYGHPIGENYKIVQLPIGPTDNYTSVLVSSDDGYDTHSFKTATNKEIKSLTMPQKEVLSEEKKEEQQKFLELLEFNN